METNLDAETVKNNLGTVAMDYWVAHQFVFSCQFVGTQNLSKEKIVIMGIN